MDKKREMRIELLKNSLKDPRILQKLGIEKLPTTGKVGVKWDLHKSVEMTTGKFKGGFTKEFKTSDELIELIAEFTEVGRKGYGSISFTLEVDGVSNTLKVNDNNGFVQIDEKDAFAILAWCGGNAHMAIEIK